MHSTIQIPYQQQREVTSETNINSKSMYRLDIELLRIISSFGIVCFHSRIAGSKYWYFSLVIFLLISGFLSGQGMQFTKSINKRFARIMIPWAIWFAIYGINNLLHKKPFIDLSDGIIRAILCSPSIHLWYLPYIFIILVLSDLIKRAWENDIFAISCGCLSIVTLCSVEIWRAPSLQIGYPWAQYIHGGSAILFGFFLSKYSTIKRPILFVLVILNIASAIYAATTPKFGIEYAIAFPVMSIAVLFGAAKKISINSNTCKISQCSLGVYLIHIFVLSNTRKILQNSVGIFFPTIIFAISLILVLFVKKKWPKLSNVLF